MADEEQQGDVRLEWLRARVRNAYAHLKDDKFQKAWLEPATMDVITRFLDGEMRTLVLYSDSLTASTAIPKRLPKGKCIYFLKSKAQATPTENVGDHLSFHDMSSDMLVHLERLVRDVYLPLLTNPANQAGWGEVASREITERLHSFLANVSVTVGHQRGETVLPLPMVDRASQAPAASVKDRVHLLEGAVIVWTKQIKHILNRDSESELKGDRHPTPDAELKFWRSKAESLNSIFEQLQSERVRRLLQFLDMHRSTYCAPFAKLCREVFAARTEANDNVKYLTTLEVWIAKLTNDAFDFGELPKLFRPIMHILLLIWKNSRYYNTPARLVVIVREICNAIIAQSVGFCNGARVFRALEEEEEKEAIASLQKQLEVCNAFKAVYADYKATAAQECPSNPWRIQNNALFLRLDSFVERAHDVLEMTEIIVKFGKLQRVVIGGTKGSTLTRTIEAIFADFEKARNTLQAVQYDVLNVEVPDFDDDYYQFRSAIRVLERRLASVLNQAFEDQATVVGRFKVLESFDVLLERPVIQDELERKHVALVQGLGADLKRVQEIFLTERDSPPISWNLPTVSGSLTWCRSLHERIRLPMDKVRDLGRAVLDREEAKEATKLYSTIVASLEDFEHAKIEDWSASIEEDGEAKLRLPLLRRGMADPRTEVDERVLFVNFDPALQRLLREVKYFLLLGLDVPAAAVTVYESHTRFRRQRTSLELLMSKYNSIIREMLPVEEPLMRQQLQRIDTTLQRGLVELDWQSESIDGFIEDAAELINAAYKTLFDLKGHLDNIAAHLAKWVQEPMLQRKPKPMTPDEFENMYKGARGARYNSIKDDDKAIQKELKASHGVISVSKSHPSWLAYTAFVNGVVLQGVARLVRQSLDHLVQLLDPEYMRKQGLPPMIIISLQLDQKRNDVRFNPSVDEDDDDSIWDILDAWVGSFYTAAEQLRRLDEQPMGSFRREMESDMQVQATLAQLSDRLEQSADDCEAIRKGYLEYEWLWTTDRHDAFEEFRKSAVLEMLPEEVQELYRHADDEEGGSPARRGGGGGGGGGGGEGKEEEEDGKEEEEDEAAVQRMVIPDLNKYDREIRRFAELQEAVANMPSPLNVGWLRIDTEPAKLSIGKTLQRWRDVYTAHLRDLVVEQLKELKQFMAETSEGLAEEVPAEGDYQEPLQRVMAHIRNVNKTMAQRDARFAPLRATVALLKSHGVAVDDVTVDGEKVVDYLDEAAIAWDDTKTRTFSRKEEVFGLQTKETANVKERVSQFYDSTRQFRNDFRKNAPFGFKGSPDEAYKQIDQYLERLEAFERGAAALSELEDLFELTPSKYPDFPKTRSEARQLKQLWDMKASVDMTFSHWQELSWESADIEVLMTQLEKMRKFLKEFGDRDQIIKAWGVFQDTELAITNMRKSLEVMLELHSDTMKDRHWAAIAKVCNVRELEPDEPGFTLESMFELHLHRHVNDVQDVVDLANNESKIETKINRVATNWRDMVVDLRPHKDEVQLIRPSEELLEMLEGDQMELQTIKGMGKFAEHFENQITTWDTNLQETDEVLKVWGAVTKSWQDLEVIFMESEDIQMSLPEDTKRFQEVDSKFKELMKQAMDDRQAISMCTKDGRKDDLKAMAADLEKCQKSLKDYLDMKKKKFPRFYFMSYKALLQTLSNGSNPPVVAGFLGACYDAMNALKFREPEEEGAIPNVAYEMIAKDGEQKPFYKDFVIPPGTPVENWLNDLTKMQGDTLRHELLDAQERAANWEVEGEKPRHIWLEDFTAQTVLAASQIIWTEETERALEEQEGGQDDALKRYLGVCKDRLDALIARVLTDLSKPLRTKIITIITIDVHNKDVVEKLMRQKNISTESFLWAQQLRNYWNQETMDVDIKITDFATKYTYEWIGNTGRLVITPLTDRCYITLTMALRLMLGGAPAGPAGTGKTETTKDLARALALPCYVFNCSDQMNFQGLADIFKGLAQVGAWGCFDEFNRISIEVLSVVATQVESVLDAVKLYSKPANRPEEFQDAPAGSPPVQVGPFELNGDPVVLVPTVGMFITMNPGYAGRTELPENLKALFRSCAMIRPDLAPICENMLMSEGFRDARDLSVKMVTLYGLSTELLSPQHHYDWGLRAVKSVLRVAGSLKRQEPETDENLVLMRALRDFNTPKMPLADIAIFKRLIQDLFPGMTVDVKLAEDVQRGAQQASRDAGLQPDETFVSKVVQFRELLDVRHSVMVLGQAGTGKSEVWRMLQGHHNLGFERQKPAILEVLNPKAVTSDELYGTYTLSKDWKDGCLTIIMRGMSECNRELGYHAYQSNKWIVLDGDIDAIWIESMNTVMDDNKTLTLVSNERVPLKDSMRMVFEIDSLANATPATVSRAGILYINETDVGWEPYRESWIARRKRENERAHLRGLFDKYIAQLFEELRRGYEMCTPQFVFNMVTTVCRYLECFLDDMPDNATPEELENVFVFALVWAYGGALNGKKPGDPQSRGRKEFHDLLSGMVQPTVKFPKTLEGNENPTCFDFFYDCANKRWRPWLELVDDYVPASIGGPNGVTFGEIQVQTVDSTRIAWLTNHLVRRGYPVMYVGKAGTGKSVMMDNFLRSLPSDQYLYNGVAMNYFMSHKLMQAKIDGAIDKRSGRVYGPPTGKKLIFFVDDINLPYKEEYGTQNALSLVRQMIDHKTYFDRDDLGLRKQLVDVQFVAGMNPTAGSFTISARLQRFFTVIGCLMPSQSDLLMIYESILSGHMQRFKEPVRALAPTITQATIDLHQRVSQSFLPAATTFMYNWNMRELSNVYQGLTLAQPAYYQKPVTFLRLWLHECQRVFQDRMVDTDDQQAFQSQLRKVTDEHFRDMDKEALFAQPLAFTSFAGQPGGEPSYISLPEGQKGWEVLSKTVDDLLVEHNQQRTVMDLVLFDDAIEHVCRIARIISNPSGHAMLVGVGGSGKQSLSRLAAFICGYEAVQLAITSKFTVMDLLESLRKVYTDAAIKDIGQIFLLTDTQIVNEEFLVYVNDMLSSGWIDGLFEREEMDGFYSQLRNEAKSIGVLVDDKSAMFDFFMSKVARNLHLVLCFSPVGEAFRIRARRFPGLINCTTIDRFMEWPEDALVSVSENFIGTIELPEEELRSAIAQHMANAHLSVSAASEEYRTKQRRHNYVTPKSFLSLIAFYGNLLEQKRKESGDNIKRLDNGLSALLMAQQTVDELKTDLERTMVEVHHEVEATSALQEHITKEKADAAEQEAEATQISEAAAAEKEKSMAVKAEADEALAAAKPAMEAAEEALRSLDVKALQTLKSLAKPPAGVDDVTDAVAILVFGKKKKSELGWKAAVKLMNNPNQFLQQLQEFAQGEPARTFGDDMHQRLQVYREMPYFNAEGMASKSSAAVNLCSFVLNVLDFNIIYRRTKPLMEAAAEAEGQMNEAIAAKDKAEGELSEVRAKVAKLEEDLASAIARREAVEEKARLCEEKMGLANRLINGLASEKERWGIEVQRLRDNETKLIGNVLLASAFVSYLGAFDYTLRNHLWQEVWIPDIQKLGIPLTDDVDPLQLLTNESQTAGMLNEGLPADRISIENGAITVASRRWPLFIDPQLQGIKWLRSRLEDKQLTMMQLTQKDWLTPLRNAISMGTPVIIENCAQELDATLDPVLSGQVVQRGRNLFLSLGGEEVPYDTNFRLFLQTKLPNPHYKPEVQAQCALINFIATEEGLKDQLLATVVSKEKPELEETKAELQSAFNKYKMDLIALEDDLLDKLANAPDDILSDVALIEGLEATKKAVVEIEEAVAKGKVTEQEINLARQVYVPVAEEGAMLYFMITQLSSIDHMYQYSLDSFVLYFLKAIREAKASDDAAQRVIALRDTLRIIVYAWVSRGLFEKHKLVLLAQLTFQLMARGKLEGHEFHPELFSFLVTPERKLGDSLPAGVSEWLDEASWYAIQALASMEGSDFAKLPLDIQEVPGRFREWFNHVTPESEKLPLDWSMLDKEPFKKLLVLRCMRPDRLTVAMSQFVAQTLPAGETFVDCDSTLSFLQVLEQTWSDSTPATPIFFILSPGGDVMSDMDKLALAHGKEKGHTYHNVSMGQGQDKTAEEKLALAHKQGHWVILNNIHLMPRWLIKLEKMLDEFNLDNEGRGSHEEFRIFLTAEPAKGIPIGILNRSIKLTNEPPTGLKANLKRAFASFSPEQINDMDGKQRAILFGLCHFHAVMIERKKFGPKGFNMMYPFGLGDLRDSSVCLANYLENASSKIPWDDLRYLFGQILYGGHIVNDFDRLLCVTYLEHFLRDELLDEMELFPFNKDEGASFMSPSPTTYDRYLEHIETALAGDTPIAFGLHPNAQIGFRTAISEEMFQTLQELQPRDSAAAAGERSPRQEAERQLEEILDMVRGQTYDLEDVAASMDDGGGGRGPFMNVLLLELEQMNTLLSEMERSLMELELGFQGKLTMSEAMDELESSLFLKRVPSTWSSRAWPSLRALPAWRADLAARMEQLGAWRDNPLEIPMVTWISGMVNPQSFLTAIRQQTAQDQNEELDKLLIQTDVTKKTREDIDAAPGDGAYVVGLFLQGARWDVSAGQIEKSRPREMYCAMPVINARSIKSDRADTKGIYSCPVYKTEQRGPTYVFSAQLKTKAPAARWIMAGVACVMDVGL